MENIHQIKTINTALQKEKERWVFELSKLTLMIERKKYLVDKMLIYQNEYNEKGKLEVSKANPMLHKNLDLFYKKMLEALFNAESELERLNSSKNSLLVKIQSIDQKIKLMDIFQERIVEHNKTAADRQEQLQVSDLTINKYSRGDHD
jgi:hypothetical protein